MWMTQAVHRSLRLQPQRAATIHNGRTRTVAESADRIARLAGALAALGVTDDDRVGILAHNSDRYHEALMAIPWSGGVVNPINTRWALPEMVYALDESGVEILFVDQAFTNLVPELRERLPGLAAVIHMADGPPPEELLDYDQLVAQSSPLPDRMRGGDDLFGLFYTGGTTGRSKAVMLSHANMLIAAFGALATEHELVTRGGSCLHVAPMFHLAAIGVWTLANQVGSTHVTLSSFTPESVAQTTLQHGVTDILLVPTMVQMLVGNDPDPAAFDSVQSVIYGASSMSEALLDKAIGVFRAAGFIQGYGMTELAPFGAILSKRDHLDPIRRRSNGTSVLNTELRVVDAQDRDVETGTVGEVLVRGGNVMVGYLNQPEATAAALRGGWMHTGDAGYLDADGYIHIVDRIKDMIITGGENVYSTEVENALSEHPGVETCAVVGIPNERWGEAVHAAVVLRPGAVVSETELRDHCRVLIAGYKVPQAITFVDGLPISGAGKILKHKVAEMVSSGRGPL
ncbi:fatty-acid--CoA ligase [Mycobacterium florentinum]|uniref:Long-chain-fatty-acid--CoA ligase FadD13 n=1 Tax=Mycobacterium florentinum TaxID=292462 RepID=A0A1X1TTW7_MYCFL|nr:long-chain-fatty-acid--CoA ligase [Mycobacterium florentinum]MCV7408509.1 long-chain-fatty-acid--CoA ligase [Mycobacterium florentinum]ORV48034.1 fatty-acid--CoA ligase [Mycobacterium florentinum]BBX77990.1 fatty-acid--CoA ligase [Mycobacterium florentinum]